jgi:hypothetical protein
MALGNEKLGTIAEPIIIDDTLKRADGHCEESIWKNWLIKDLDEAIPVQEHGG